MFIQNNNNQMPYLTLISLSALWGAGFYLTQSGLEFSGAFGFVALRCAVAAMILAFISRKALLRLTRYEIIGGSAIAFLAVIGFGTCAMALESENGARVAFLSSLYVLIVPLAQFVIFKERPPIKLLFGGILAIAGIGILSGSFASGRLTLSFGDVLSLISAVTIALEIVLMGYVMRRANPARLAAFVMGATAVFGLLIAALRHEGLPSASSELILIILIFGLITAYIQFAMGWAQKMVSASNAAIIYSMEPIFAALIGLTLGEIVGVHELIGGSLMVVGAIIASARFTRIRNKSRMISFKA